MVEPQTDKATAIAEAISLSEETRQIIHEIHAQVIIAYERHAIAVKALLQTRLLLKYLPNELSAHRTTRLIEARSVVEAALQELGLLEGEDVESESGTDGTATGDASSPAAEGDTATTTADTVGPGADSGTTHKSSGQ